MNSLDDYTYPGTHVLKNKADLRDQTELQRFERGVTAVRIQELKENQDRGDFSLRHMQDIHRQIFRDVYEWAGEIRTVDLAKGPASDRTVFVFKENISTVAEKIKTTIEQSNYLRGMEREKFAAKTGELYSELNALHAFREGNGRTTREYLNQLAKESGYQFDFTKVDRQQWNESAKQSVRGNLEPIKEIFYEITVVERAVAFDKANDREGQREALAKYPELDAAFKKLYEKQLEGGDLEKAHAEIASELHTGKLPVGDVTIAESQRVIDNAGAYRGLMIRDAAELGGQYKGEVVAVSSHHAMLKVGDMVAVRYERTNLDRDVHVGERLTIQYGREQSQVFEKGSEPIRERGRDSMQIEHERGFSTS